MTDNNHTLAMQLYREGQFERAASALRPLADKPDLQGRLARYYCAMSHRAMGLEHLQSGQYELAGWHFRQAAALIGKRADLAEYLLVVYARTGRHEDASVQADLLAGGDPTNPLAHVRLAQAQWQAGRRQIATMSLLEAVRKLGDHCPLHLNLGLFYAAVDELEPARKHLLKAVECDCASSSAWKHLGLVESARGDFYQARTAFHRACMLDPADLVLAYQLSLAAKAAAQTGFPAAVTLPEFSRPVVHSQIRQLAEYIASEPDFVEACIALPADETDNELFEMLVSVLRVALVSHEGYADLHYLLSVSLQRLGQLDPARQEAARAVQINSRYTKALVQLANMEASLERRMEAIGHYRQALAIGAEWPDVHLALGRLLGQSGMTASAGEHFRRALSLNKNYKQAKEELAALAA